MMGALLILLIGVLFFTQTSLGGAVERLRSFTDEDFEPDNAGPRSSAWTPAGGSTKRRKFVELLMHHKSDDYVWGGESKSEGGFDCSGIIQHTMITHFGLDSFPRTSAEQIAHCKKISVRRAVHTVGAVLYTPGHIAVSRGDGTTIEARSTALDIGVWSATRGRSWTTGGLIPELS